jgi:pimeloyl-ACP methyl ester carboxylesterase
MNRSLLWRRIRRVWVTLGIGVTVLFVGWSLLAYRASDLAKQALRDDPRVAVDRGQRLIRFMPSGSSDAEVGLLFFPGALVDPVAYAPLARAAAAAGFPAVIVTLPRRGAFGGAEAPELYGRADSILGDAAPPRGWVVAGHSRGAVVASTLAARRPAGLAGLLLVGTSHPRDVDLSFLEVPVTKVAAGRDGLASRAEVQANAHLLPPSTRWVWIDGGNHSQFAWYGFQPGDRRALLPRGEQQRATIAAMLALLRQVAARAG